VLDEGNKLWAFFQRFIDEHSVDRIKTIRSKDTGITQKINCMDWLARYAEFLTPDQITSVVLSFKDIYTGPNQDLSEAYVAHKHNSESIPTIVQMIRSIKMKKSTLAVDDETFDQNLTILLSILEPLLINDQNLDTLFKLQFQQDLCDLIISQPLPQESTAVDPQKGYRNSFKYAIRCTTSCLRSDIGVNEFLKRDINFKRALKILE